MDLHILGLLRMTVSQFCCLLLKGRFTRFNFGPIIISNFFVYDEK